MVFIAAPKKIETPYIKVNPKKTTVQKTPFHFEGHIAANKSQSISLKIFGDERHVPTGSQTWLAGKSPIYS